ncbi:carboxypeptidase regulatory-like domain-containing protein [Algoriphagus sp. H41]|uniref:Carboxypeptidase regulatory-like domain-containing protein n=1 Tax=Algoriphagus oliviformis TaxID=2811231 RepID=A0ABS3C301_9BACT|nr:carboxypeptidase regulatory-like domain-containing protein [Algoriphagus oliviformis]MBN7811489.1 carboxypeptidase regulatory-like domain-containing protein [Algoriphagus oliviformis]
MKRLLLSLLAVLVLGTTQNCKPYKPEGQGITGTLTWVEGNQMPSISDGDNTEAKASAKGIQRTVRIYPLVKFQDLKVEEGLYTAIAEKPLTEVESDENGTYSVQLSPGRYSVFVVEKGGLFANIFDGEGYVQPVTVKESEWTLLDIEVNYKAVY